MKPALVLLLTFTTLMMANPIVAGFAAIATGEHRAPWNLRA
jgi:hypothetical protein